MFRRHLLSAAAAIVMGTATLVGAARAAGPEVAEGPGALPECFKPYAADTKFFQWQKKDGPYKIALANGFVGNTWRIQMIKTLKAYVEQPDVKPMVKELKVVSTGTDVAAQIGAIENFINQGYDANTGKYVDMYKAGIIDPVKVVRTALANAASIAALLLTTEALVTNIDKDNKDAKAEGSVR